MKKIISLTTCFASLLALCQENKKAEETTLHFSHQTTLKTHYNNRFGVEINKAKKFGGHSLVFRVKDRQKQTIYLDENLNQQHDENEPLLSPGDFFTLTFQQGDRTCEYTSRYYNLFNNMLYFASHTVLEAKLNQTTITIRDANFDGCFDDQDLISLQHSRDWSKLSKDLFIDGKFYHLEIADHGLTWKLSPSQVETIAIKVQGGNKSITDGQWTLEHQNMNFKANIRLNQTVNLPEGDYKVIYSAIKGKDDKGEIVLEGNGTNAIFTISKANSQLTFSFPKKVSAQFIKHGDQQRGYMLHSVALLGDHGESFQARPRNLGAGNNAKCCPELYRIDNEGKESLLSKFGFG